MPVPLILAPLKKVSRFDALIDSGADMVYAGYSMFSRGGKGYGLNYDEMKILAEKAACSGKKAAAALNIIPDVLKTEDFFNALERLYLLGIKDFILNDAGLISEAKKKVPEIKVTASVGCGVVNTEDVLFFEELGADTVVLNPLITPNEVTEIRGKTKIKLELFIFFEKEYIIKSKCLLTGYIKEGSSKKGVNCGKICAFNWSTSGRDIDSFFNISKPFKSSLIELTNYYISAGIDIFKVEGRNFPEKIILKVVKSLRQKIQEKRND